MRFREYFDMLPTPVELLASPAVTGVREKHSMTSIFRHIMPLLAVLSALFLTAAFATAQPRTELIMMEEDGCGWCERWMEEIGGVYDKTAEGRLAPLRRVDIHDAMPADLEHLKPSYYTPTFILVRDGQEIGRILGHPGEDFFWSMLQELLDKLPPKVVDQRVEVRQ